jgi:polyferredoxin
MSATRRTSEPPSRAWPFSLRDTFRLALGASLVVALVQYIRFWAFVQTGNGTPVARPNVADAFLPLGGLAALKAWLSTGRFDTLHPAAIVIVVAVLVTAWLFRRAPCAWLCPIGMLSESLAGLGRRLFGRNLDVPKPVDRGLLGIKYAGTFGFLLWLLSTPEGSVRAFMQTPFYAVADLKLFEVYAKVGIGVVAALCLFAIMSVFVKSAWCRYLCPYGALQGILGLLSPVVLAKDEARCTGCGRCNRACPNCVDVASASGSVVSAECMGCGSCVAACPRAGTLGMKLGGRTPINPAAFALAFCAVVLVIVGGAALTGHFGDGLPTRDYRAVAQLSADVHLPMTTQGGGAE